jgi:gamma-glutamyltranspeptidase
VALIALKTLYLGYDLKTAIDQRRVHHQLSPYYLETEDFFPKVFKKTTNFYSFFIWV